MHFLNGAALATLFVMTFVSSVSRAGYFDLNRRVSRVEAAHKKSIMAAREGDWVACGNQQIMSGIHAFGRKHGGVVGTQNVHVTNGSYGQSSGLINEMTFSLADGSECYLATGRYDGQKKQMLIECISSRTGARTNSSFYLRACSR